MYTTEGSILAYQGCAALLETRPYIVRLKTVMWFWKPRTTAKTVADAVTWLHNIKFFKNPADNETKITANTVTNTGFWFCRPSKYNS